MGSCVFHVCMKMHDFGRQKISISSRHFHGIAGVSVRECYRSLLGRAPRCTVTGQYVLGLESGLLP